MDRKRTSRDTLNSLFIVLALGPLAGCASVTGNYLKKRATAEFNCPKEQLTSERLAMGQFLVKGCGKRAVYTCTDSFCARNSELIDETVEPRR